MTIEDQYRMRLMGERRQVEEARRMNEELEKSRPPKTETEQTRGKISGAEAMLMMGVALLYDGGQAAIEGFGGMAALIPFVGWGVGFIAAYISAIVGIYAWLTFFIWFTLKGVGWKSRMKLQIILALTGLLEVMPGLNIIPGWTFAVAANLIIYYMESRAPLARKTA